MNITKEQWIQIGKIVLVAVLAILAVFGYDLGVIQPRYANLVKTAPVPVTSQGLGFIQFQNMRVNGQSAFVGAESHAGIATFDTITVTNLVSQTLGFNATAASTFVSTTMTGPLTVTGVVSPGSLSTTGDVGSRNITATGSLVITGTSKLIGAVTSLGTISATNTTALGNATATGNVVATGDVSSRNITATGTISDSQSASIAGSLALGTSGETFSGPIKFGYTASQTNGATITHGFATAPTACVVIAGTGTLSATVTSIGATTFVVAVPITGPVYWMCGK